MFLSYIIRVALVIVDPHSGAARMRPTTLKSGPSNSSSRKWNSAYTWDGNLWVLVIVMSWVNKQAGFWSLHKSENPIRSQESKLTQLLTMTKTKSFRPRSLSWSIWRWVSSWGWASCRDGNLWVVVIVKSCINRQVGSWLAAQEWETSQVSKLT